jgi:AraC-like DNA-binding protein
LSPRTVRRIREYIDGHIGQRIRVELLAKLANLSVCYFVRAFKRSMSVTPHEYLIRRRVELTMRLLSRTDMPLSEIAFAAGFGIKAIAPGDFVSVSECRRATTAGSPPEIDCTSIATLDGN